MTSQVVPPAVDPDSSDAAARQATALEVSGWGERFTFFQPRNLCFWVFVVLTAGGVVKFATYYSSDVGFYGEALAISAVICLLAGAAWWWWFRHIDRWERQPVGLIVVGFIWGALPATTLLALSVNNAFFGIYSKVFGQAWTTDWGAGATAPITEESIKLCGFVLLLGLAPRLVRTANDGLIIGAFVGLGFGVLEDFLYAEQAAGAAFATNAVGNATHMSFTRAAFSAVSHPLFSALVCSGVIYLIGTSAQPRRIGRGLASVAAGVGLHFVWDSMPALSGGNDVVAALLLFSGLIIGFVLVHVAFRAAVPREHQFVRDIMAPEVRAGTLTTEEVDGVLDRKARKAFRKSAPNRKAKRARKHLRAAILDLTHDVAAAKGADTDEVRHSRSELARQREAAATSSG